MAQSQALRKTHMEAKRKEKQMKTRRVLCYEDQEGILRRIERSRVDYS